MQIETKNYNDFYKKYDYTKVEEIVITSINLREQSPNFSSLINTLNTIPILTPTTTQKLIINFEDFTILNKIILNQKNYFKRKLNKWFKTDFNINNDYAFYSKNEKTIYIREELFEQGNENHTFSQYLKKNISQTDFLNFVVLHEIGHAIHHNYYLNNKNHFSFENSQIDFINSMISFNGYLDLSGNTENNYKFRNKDLSVMIYHAVTEGFADLYACISIGELYPKNKAIELIDEVINARKRADKEYEYYFSYQTLENYLLDLREDKTKFYSFDNVHQYMSNIIQKTIVNIIETQLSKTTSPEIQLNNRYLGVINKQLNLNVINSNQIINILNEKYNFKIEPINHLKDEFKYGEMMYENNKHIINKKFDKINIKKLRDKFLTKKSFKKNTL